MYGREGEKSYQNESGMQTTVLINNSLEIYINLSMTLISSVYRCSWCRGRERKKNLQTQLNKWSDRKEFNRSLGFAKLFPKTLEWSIGIRCGAQKVMSNRRHFFRLTEFVCFQVGARSPNLQTRPNRCFLFVLVPWLRFWLLFNYK